MMTRYMRALLFEVDPLDPVVFGGVGIVLLALATLASAGPALRASRLDPVRSIQAE
jgi:putative ABC transport system permease protein